MEDRFKFRAWHYNKYEVDYGDNNKYFYDAQDAYDFLTGVPANSFGDLLRSEFWTVEQCIGLKDKNGKLIYEGDIVSAITFDGHNRQFIVKYVEEDACFGLFVSKSMYISFNKVYEDSFEVIGNMHENPELLEADNAR